MAKIGYYSGKDIGNNVFSFILKQVQNNPQKTIFIWQDGTNTKTLSYTAFMEDAKHVAYGLHEKGIAENDKVIVFLPVSITMYQVLAALHYLGAIPVFFDSWTRKLHLQTAIQQIHPKAIISTAQAFTFFANNPLLNLIPLKFTETQLPSSDDKIDMAKVEQEHTALITFTTGSSGTPKAANRTHRFLAAQHYALNRYIHYTENDTDLTSFPIFSLNAIASGATSVIPCIDIGTPKETDSNDLYNQINEDKITNLTVSPSLLNNLANYCSTKKLTLPSLKSVITGGAPISFIELNTFAEIAPKANIQILYGSTEVEPITHISLTELREHFTEFNHTQAGILVGKVDQELEYKIIKISKDPVSRIIEVPPNDVGELIVSGEHVCNSYVNNPEAFQKTKIVEASQKVWHRTGDLVRLDKDHNLWLVGRVHNVICRNNEYLYPIPVETEIKKLPFVRHVAYLGLSDSALGERASVIVEPIEWNDSKTSEWQALINTKLAENSFIADQILFVKTIPMDPRHHSKVEYNQLRAQLTKI